MLRKTRSIGGQIEKCINLEKRRAELDAQHDFDTDDDDRRELFKMQEVIFKTTKATRKPEEVGWDSIFLGKKPDRADILYSHTKTTNSSPKEDAPNPMRIFE